MGCGTIYNCALRSNRFVFAFLFFYHPLRQYFSDISGQITQLSYLGTPRVQIGRRMSKISCEPSTMYAWSKTSLCFYVQMFQLFSRIKLESIYQGYSLMSDISRGNMNVHWIDVQIFTFQSSYSLITVKNKTFSKHL